MMANTAPAGMSNDTSRTARTPPKLLCRPLALNSTLIAPPRAEASLARIELRGLHQAARHEQHDERQRHAVDDEAQIADAAQQFGQQREQDRAPDRPDQRSHAADDHHRQDGEGLGDEECVGHQRADEGRVEASGRAADRRADAEREHLPGRAVDAERRGRDVVLADRRQRLADRRAHELIEDEVGQQREAGDQIEQRDRIAEVDHRQARNRDRGRRRDRVDAERALRQADPVEQDLMDDDRKAERRDREIMPAQPHREQREDHAGEPGECDAAPRTRPRTARRAW